MKGALIILLITVAVGLLLWCREKLHHHHDPSAPADTPPADKAEPRPARCCGMHIVCEKLSEEYSEDTVYYDDEELDRFRGRQADEYTAEEVDEFRDVLLTMRPSEITGWLDSLDRRRILLPDPLRDEVILLLSTPA